MHDTDKIGVQVIVYGVVQGVGFRAFTMGLALSLGVYGQVLNQSDGSVKIIAHGLKTDINKLIASVRVGPQLSRVDKLDLTYLDFSPVFNDFQIIKE